MTDLKPPHAVDLCYYPNHKTFGIVPVCPACQGAKLGLNEDINAYMTRLQKLYPLSYQELLKSKTEEFERMYKQRRYHRQSMKAIAFFLLPIALMAVAMTKVLKLFTALGYAVREHKIKGGIK